MLHTLGEAALRTALLAGVVQSALWLLRIHQARLLLAAWTIVLAASMTMPLLPRFTPLTVPLDPVFATTWPALSKTLIDGAADLLQRPAPQAEPGPAITQAPAQQPVTPWLDILYAVVAGLLILRVALGVALSLRILARAAPIRPHWAAGMRLHISRDIAGPVTIARCIVLPIDVVRWPAATRQAVLAHEQAHVARLDFAMLVLSQLNRAVFWFSPLSWWLHRRLVALTELASDDHALASTRDRLAYAEILLEMGRRSGPLPRGPAMARPSTLPHRIDRILLNPAIPPTEGRSQPLLMTLGVAGLSLAIAGLTPGTAPFPAMPLLASRQDDPIDPPPAPEPLEPAPLQQSPAATTPPSMAPYIDAGPQPPQSPAPQKPVPLTAAQPTRPAPAPGPSPPPSSHTASRAMPKSPAPLPPSRPMETRPHTTVVQPGPQDDPSRQAFGTTAAQSRPAAFQLAARTGSMPDDAERRSLPHRIAFGAQIASPPTASPLDFEGVVGSTCTGTLAVGTGVSTSSALNQPNVVAGQRVSVQAQFFRKQNGGTWVRFHAFQRPPLDLPVRLARSGIAWTGEYGISYTVQGSGQDRLVGLAARIANDSARLELSCLKSATALF